MNLDLEALKADALAAVPGPYTFVSNPEDGYGAIQHHDNAPGAPSGTVAKVAVRWTWLKQQEATGRMFAALHPAAVLALIDLLEDEHAANAMLIEENDRLQARVAVLEERLRTGVAP